jgi:hypothetical protein
MSRYALYLRLVMVLVVLATLATALGNEPWGPH